MNTKCIHSLGTQESGSSNQNGYNYILNCFLHNITPLTAANNIQCPK